MNPQSSLNAYILQALKDNSSLQAFSDLNGESFTFADVTLNAARFHIMFKEMGLKPGDKIAFCGKNSSRWAIGCIASLTYGTVTVPILHEFTPDSIHHLVDHSDSALLFVDESIWKKLTPSMMPKLKGAIRIADYSLLYASDGVTEMAVKNIDELAKARIHDGFTASDLHVYEGDPDEAAIINYTSGSTGFSKGVVLTNRNLWSNVQYCIDGLTFLLPGDGTICMLPLAHMFGLMVENLHPFVKGCHIHFITKVPSPRIILEAFGKVKPKLIITVPLVLEKIIKSKVMPALQKPMMKLLLAIPGINNIIYGKVRKQIINAFGGEMKEIILGGAGLNKDVEKLLRRMKFPYTVGYGMTECGPLIAYVPWAEERMTSCGRVVPRMEVRVDSESPSDKPGVLWVKGDNVMKGYYKNEEATRPIMKDGWMNTGDICTIDKDGFIYIHGRDKSMILGPSGQNIYPEEIEMVLNNLPLISETVVIDDGGKIVALIHPDMDEAGKQGLTDEQIESLMRENITKANSQLSAYSRISDMRIHKEEFEKTPKRSIKRYLYQSASK